MNHDEAVAAVIVTVTQKSANIPTEVAAEVLVETGIAIVVDTMQLIITDQEALAGVPLKKADVTN